MKKLDNDNIIVLSFKLCLICFVMSVILAYLNSVTAPKIEASRAAEAAREMEAIISGADFVPVNDSVYEAKKDGETAGYIANITTEKGYGGKIGMLVGFSADFEIIGIKFVGDFSETPGLGSRVKEDEFTSKFIGKKDTEVIKGKASRDNEVEAISGATISSRAVNDGVLLAQEAVKEALK